MPTLAAAHSSTNLLSCAWAASRAEALYARKRAVLSLMVFSRSAGTTTKKTWKKKERQCELTKRHMILRAIGCIGRSRDV